ncbi:kinase-like domain-containing protein [Rhodocollybia butyracea]|uniref:Kinase-like domain-containing protein n=1 Tax=Rhodocollybia butyracea TaxID=206335 RepID=A0A9P5Q1U9_9AGAR|nr:kinase-like domain-containing protein [Rhodocollybia butyracea]
MDPPSLEELTRRQDEDVRAFEGRQEKLDILMASRDLKALQNVASRVMQKTATKVFLIGQGGFNMVFAIQFEDGSDIVARAHGSHALQDVNTPKEEILFRIESEFATIRYLKEKTTIPVPEVLHLDIKFDNSVGAPYTLQERIIGRKLADMLPWKGEGMSSDQLVKVVQQVAQCEAQLLQLSFDAIGSIMYDSVTAEYRVDRAISWSSFGPDHRGPWNSTSDYLHSLVSLQRGTLRKSDWIENRKKWLSDFNDMIESPLEDIEAEARADHAHYTSWFAMLEEALVQVDFSAFDPPNYPFVLVHDDLSVGNVLIDYADPSCMHNIIDWEGSSVVPFWLALSTKLIAYNDLYDQPLVAQLLAARLDVLKASVKSFPDKDTLSAMQKLIGLHTILAKVKLHNLPAAIATKAVDNFVKSRSSNEVDHFKPMMELGRAYVNPQSREIGRLLGWKT